MKLINLLNLKIISILINYGTNDIKLKIYFKHNFLDDFDQLKFYFYDIHAYVELWL